MLAGFGDGFLAEPGPFQREEWRILGAERTESGTVATFPSDTLIMVAFFPTRPFVSARKHRTVYSSGTLSSMSGLGNKPYQQTHRSFSHPRRKKRLPHPLFAA